ncbi:hypothetical protein [Fodinibius sp.]|uniref:hypothetical protein n=1 Tax=Fodinibius sp. TaxID=1872440 RepID=UPI002ACE3A93|nr:hypothetical protein [Fodinibius sp.]MDZ7660375.1 hypothetical protein [Fodinibius sp.]
MKTLKLLPILLITGLLFGCESYTPVSPESELAIAELQLDAAAKVNTKSTADIFNFVTGDLIGKSTLHRNGNGITVNFKTTGLMPGHAYTLWWVVWNKPENCATPGACVESDFANALNVEVQLLYATGSIAGNNGKGNFSAHLKENDDSGSVHEIFGLPNFGGLQDAHAAEIHAVLRSHGPKIPGQVGEQINSYEGGCVVNFPAFTEIPDEAGECGDIIAAIHGPL